MPVLNRAFEHVVPGIIPASVPTISLPDLITPGAASPMPLNRTVPPPNYQVPAHSLRLQNAQGYQQRLRAPLPGQIQVRHIVFCDNLKPPTSRSRWFKEITRDTTPPASLNLSLSRGEAGILDYFCSCVGCWQSIKAPCTIIKVTSFLLAKSHVICKIFEAVNQVLRVTNKDWTI